MTTVARGCILTKFILFDITLGWFVIIIRRHLGHEQINSTLNPYTKNTLNTLGATLMVFKADLSLSEDFIVTFFFVYLPQRAIFTLSLW